MKAHTMKLRSSKEFFGTPKLPGDKSISHRCLILAALAQGRSEFENMSEALDVLSTEKVLTELGVEITRRSTSVQVNSTGRLKAPIKSLDCGNAGTLMRLMMGVLSAQDFSSELIGDESLSQRPMRRVFEPLQMMGAKINLRDNQFAPVQIEPSRLKAIEYDLKVASAQVKSAILLAGLSAEGRTVLTGKISSRDHTERLLRYFGADIDISENRISIYGPQLLHNNSYVIPNDISAAAFWIAAGVLAEKSEVYLNHVGVNPTRMGFVNVLLKAGARIRTENIEISPEPVAHLTVKSSKLNAFDITEEEVASLIDEVPLLVLLATQADGVSKIQGVGELRYKETDRVMATVKAIEALGGTVLVEGDTLIIPGNQRLRPGIVESFHDHRIAMMAAVAKYCVDGVIEIRDFDCVDISDPYFADQITGKSLLGFVREQISEFL